MVNRSIEQLRCVRAVIAPACMRGINGGREHVQGSRGGEIGRLKGARTGVVMTSQLATGPADDRGWC